MDIQELEETAALARLNLSREELAGALPAFEQLLGFFAVMQEADGDQSLSAGHIPDGTALSGQAALSRLAPPDHFRPDTALNVPPDTPPGEELLEAAGERDGRFIVIPNVL
jgi:aspartyl-tRNA(Asn)/glutamyl-tRNA(Gln) amidotransferase subunit C